MPRNDRARFSTGVPALAGGAWLLLAALAAPAASAGYCPETERTVRFGFYAYFEPVSHDAGYRIAASGATPVLDGRLRLRPPSPTMPQVIYMADDAALIDALVAGRIGALARGEMIDASVMSSAMR